VRAARRVVAPPLRRRELAFVVLGIAITVFLLFGRPTPQQGDFSDTEWWTATALITGAVALFMTRLVLSARFSISTARVWLVLGITAHILLISFAFFYWYGSNGDHGSFVVNGEPAGLTIIDAGYFTVTTLTSTGYGDIVAAERGARALVTLQQCAGFLLVSVALVLVLTRSLRRQKLADPSTRQDRPGTRRERFYAITTNSAWAVLLAGSPPDFERGLPPAFAAVVAGALVAPVAIAGTWLARAARRRVWRRDTGVFYVVFAIQTTVLGYTYAYWVMSHAEDGAFSDTGSGDALSRIDAAYFAVTTATSTGYGDIVPRSQTARALVTGEQLTMLLVVGLALALVLSRWQHETDITDVTRPWSPFRLGKRKTQK
jgi:voltage-gated potassium channel